MADWQPFLFEIWYIFVCLAPSAPRRNTLISLQFYIITGPVAGPMPVYLEFKKKSKLADWKPFLFEIWYIFVCYHLVLLEGIL